MNLLIHIQSQIKIVIRYTDLFVESILFYISAGILLVILARSYHLNIPLLSVIFAVFSTGSLFGNLFCEKPNEIRGYLLAPWSLRSVILSKNAALIVLTTMLPLPIIITASFIVSLSVQEYLSATLFFITSVPLCMLLGNIVSISQRILESAHHAPSPFKWGIVAVSPLPYVVFKSWMNSIVLCIIFFGFSFIVWYAYQLPWLVKNFPTVFYKIN